MRINIYKSILLNLISFNNDRITNSTTLKKTITMFHCKGDFRVVNLKNDNGSKKTFRKIKTRETF